MIRGSDFLDEASRRGFGTFTGVPCSYLRPLIDGAVDSKMIRYVAATNEGDAVAIAAGSQLAGTKAVCMFQNSGLGNAVSPLASLTSVFRIPILIVVSHRGEPGGPPDEPQHALMGSVTTSMLDSLGVEWSSMPSEADELAAAMDEAERSMATRGQPYAFVVSKGTFEAEVRHAAASGHRTFSTEVAEDRRLPVLTRREALGAVLSATRPTDILVATTGYTGRELYALSNAPNELYMVGSMGCASSLGLGLAIASPHHRVIVLDGDGAALMRLGAFATLGAEKPQNLLHVLLDNGQHESTGGQPTAAATTDFARVASACGYPRVERAASADEIASLVDRATSDLWFAHVPIVPGTQKPLVRPSITPEEVADRLRTHIAGAS